jgi:hypothetical protein
VAPRTQANLPNNSSPQGRIFQIEYASEAVKQGSVVVGIVSKTHAVICAIKVCFHARGILLLALYVLASRNTILPRPN